MAFESVDMDSAGENFWENSSSGIKFQGTKKEKEEYAKKRIEHLISLLKDTPKGAYSLIERLQIFSFDPNSYALHQKSINTTHFKLLNQYLLFDSLFQRIFICRALFSDTEGKAIVQEVQSLLGPDIEWISVEEPVWPEIHEELSEHITRATAEEKRDSRDVAPQGAAEAVPAQQPSEEKKDPEEVKKMIRGLTFGEILRLMNGIFVKLQRLDEKMFEMYEQEADEQAEARRLLRQAKEQLKDEIKYEIEKLRICAEEVKRKNADLSLELD